MMKNLFEQSRSHWVRYDHYELKTAEDGKRYITPGKNAKPDVYNPLKEVPNIVLDALNVPADHARPLDALLQLLDQVQGWDEESVRLGCPLNNLMQEMSAVDEEFRLHLTAIVTRWQSRVEALLQLAQARGQLLPAVDCHAAALFIVAAWEGCVSVAKNMRSMPVFVASIEQLKCYIRQLQPD